MATHTEQTYEVSRMQHVLQVIKRYASVAQLLRLTGAMIVVAAMSLFLLQGLDLSNDLQRFLTLLVQTVILTLAGFLVSKLLNDNHGARVFFALGLISIPANFAVLGAMVYSLVELDRQLVEYPALVGWQIGGFDQLLIAIAAGAAVLLPVSYFAYAVLARSNAALFGSLAIASGLILLIPVRETVWISLIALAVFLIVTALVKRYTVNKAHLKTFEGRFALYTLFISPALIVLRSIILYKADLYTALVLSVTFYAILRIIVTRSDTYGMLSRVCYCLAATVGLLVAVLFTWIVNDVIGDQWNLPIFSSVFIPMMLELSRSARNQQTRRQIFVVSSVYLLLFCVVQCLSWGTDLSIWFTIVVSGVVGIHALRQGHIIVSIVSALVFVCYSYHQSHVVLRFLDISNWMILTILGIVVIVGASFLERFGVIWSASSEK